MADEVGLGKTICLFSSTQFVTLDVTPDPTDEEAQNVELRRAYLPQLALQPLGPITGINHGTSFLGLDSMIACVACPNVIVEANNQIKLFNPRETNVNVDTLFPKMIEKRYYPSVAAIGGVIYVFGGVQVLYDEEIMPEPIWAECLDTSQPRDKQAWVPLAKPPFCIPEVSGPMCLPRGDEEILVFGHNINEKIMRYNVRDRSWSVDKFIDRGEDIIIAIPLENPVFGEGIHTIYWLVGDMLYALDMVSKFLYRGQVYDSVLYDYTDFYLESTVMGPVLMHVKDDVFCFFTLYSKAVNSGRRIEILECTKIRVAKLDTPSGRHILKIGVIGYQSYKCENMCRLYGGVVISKSINRK